MDILRFKKSIHLVMEIWLLPTFGLCTLLYSHPQYMKFPRSPCPQQYLLSPVVLIIAILVGMKESLILVLTWKTVHLLADFFKEEFFSHTFIILLWLSEC